MGQLASCCPKSRAPKDDRPLPRSAGRGSTVRNETEDPRAPLLTKRPDRKPPLTIDPEFDKFVDTLSSDDGLLPDTDEIDALLSKSD
jgi:hypothetical protein